METYVFDILGHDCTGSGDTEEEAFNEAVQALVREGFDYERYRGRGRICIGPFSSPNVRSNQLTMGDALKCFQASLGLPNENKTLAEK